MPTQGAQRMRAGAILVPPHPPQHRRRVQGSAHGSGNTKAEEEKVLFASTFLAARGVEHILPYTPRDTWPNYTAINFGSTEEIME